MEQAETWPTPVANDDNKTPEGHLAKKPGRTVVTSLNIVATAMWPTPRSEDSESAGNHPGATDSLTGVTSLWQTPASDSFRSRGGERKDEMGLDQQARGFWATPTTQDAGKATKKLRADHQNNLTANVEHLATPAIRDGKGSYSDEAMVRKDGKSRMDQVESQAIHLNDYSHSLPAPETQPHGSESSETAPTSRRQLNPRFVEWLMGWTPGWTSLAPLAFASPATASFPQPPPSPSEPSGEDWATPTGHARTHSPRQVDHGKQLANQVDNWPTPDTQNSRGGAMRAEANGKHAMSLHHVVEGWAS